MPQPTRFYCSKCKRSIFNVMIGGVRVPIIHYIVTGQPEDTGPDLDVNGEGVRVTSHTRELMQRHVAVKRIELCEECFADAFGLKLVTAADDPMYSADQEELTAQTVNAEMAKPGVDLVEKHRVMHERPLLALKVGRGATAAPPLPPVKKPEPKADAA